jgi:exopolysaccharide biosynthesis polyprenyl glycosylphosphotransferase
VLRENNQILQSLHRLWDVLLTIAAFIAAYFIKRDLLPRPWGGLSQEPNYFTLLLLCVIIWYLVFKYSGVYRPYRKRAFVRIVINVVRNVTICLMLVVLVLFILKSQDVSRILLGLFAVLDMVFLIGSKWMLYTILQHLRKKGYNFRNVLILGCGPRADEIARSISRRAETGFRVMGCLATDDSARADEDRNMEIPVLGAAGDLQRILTTQVIDELVFAEPLRKVPEAGQYIHDAERMGISVHIMPEWGLRSIGFTPRVGSLRFEEIFGLPTLSLTTTPDHNPAIDIKNIIDFVVSSLGLVTCALPFILIALAVKIGSPGPVFFRQDRVGQNGRLFRLCKFRTMVDGADEMKDELLHRNESDGPVFKIREDPRVVPWIGTFLRKTSLDELPQLINVFKGDMSLVGPRPPLPDEITKYDMAQRRRLSMKPGITCLWQITPWRNEVSFEEWVKMDLEYIDSWSLWLDFKILFKTVGAVLTGQGR